MSVDFGVPAFQICVFRYLLANALWSEFFGFENKLPFGGKDRKLRNMVRISRLIKLADGLRQRCNVIPSVKYRPTASYRLVVFPWTPIK